MSVGPGPRARLPEGLLTALGGPRGSRARRPSWRFGVPAPLVLLLALPLGVAALRQASCAAHGWAGRAPLWRQCASPMMSAVGVDGPQGLLAYLTGRVGVELPLPQGFVTSALVTLAPGSGLQQQRGVLVLWAVVAAVLSAGLVVAVATVRDTPRADAVAVALSPVLAVSVLLSVQLVPVALAAGGLWAWQRRRPELAGALLGVAVLSGRPAVAVLLAMALVPPPGVADAVRRLLRAAGTALLLVVGPVAAIDLGLVLRPLSAWWGGGAGAGSPWFVPELARHPLGPATVAVLSLLGLALAAGLVVVLSTRRPRPAAADLALLGVVVVLLTGASFRPADAVWLVPFVALAGVRWRDHLVWAGAEATHAVALYTWLDAATDPAKGLPAGWYAAALSLRLMAVGRLAWVVWARASWEGPPPAGTLARLPPERPVDRSRVAVGDDAYPPVTEGP
ncbi:hypothetical protein ASG78_01495 [Nostocoides sp. Soil756]|nr:hypothetical protein ASG78_01495 [Tetrasphaera sp. Soil756]